MPGDRPDGDAVAVPAISAGSSLATVRSLGRKGVRTVALASSPRPPPTRSKYCHETVSVPSPYEDLSGFTDALLSVAERPDVRTVVPLREPDIYVLSKHREAFADHVATPWPPYEDVARVQDRQELLRLAGDLGVPVPETEPLDRWTGWDRPTVVKPRYAILDRDDRATYPGVRVVTGGEPDVDGVVEEMGHVPVAQEYVPGDAEFGFFALFDEGMPVATFQHRRVRSFTYTGGASVYRKSVRVPDLERHGLALLEALDWHGPAMVEFKRDDRDGTLKLMEINPRFWGSLSLPVHAGVDFPWLYYRLATGGVDDTAFDYAEGLGCHLLRGEGSYVHSLLRYDYGHVDPPPVGRELAAILGSVVRQPNFDYLSVDDPRPFVRDIYDTVRDAVPVG